MVAAELASPLHGVLGDQAGLDEVAPPDAAQHHVLSDEYELAFLALLPASAPDSFQYLVGFVEAAGPFQQQGALNGWPKYQGREDARVLQLHGAMKVGIVEAFSAQEPQYRAHAERQAEQVWLVEAICLGDGLLGHLHARLGLIGVEQGIGQGDQDLHAQRAVGAHLAERAL